MSGELKFAERIFSGSEIEMWSFHPSHDGKQLGIYIAPSGQSPVAHFVVPEKLLSGFLESMTKARADCEARQSLDLSQSPE